MNIPEEKMASQVIVLQLAVQIVSCDFKPGKKQWAGTAHAVKNAALLCENHRERVMQISTSPSEEEEEEERKLKQPTIASG